MSDILADLAGMQTPTGILCVRARIQRDHPELLESWDKAIAAHQFSTRSVADWFSAHGVKVSQEVVRNHRVGTCERCRNLTS
jgi:hypothetical protein